MPEPTSVNNAENAQGTSKDRKKQPLKKRDWRRKEPTLRQWCITLGAIQFVRIRFIIFRPTVMQNYELLRYGA